MSTSLGLTRTSNLLAETDHAASGPAGLRQNADALEKAAGVSQ